MTFRINRWSRVLLPSAAFFASIFIHFLWLRMFPEQALAQSQWLNEAVAPLSVARYIENGDYWIGLSYGVMLAFTALAFRAYREMRMCGAGSLALGGITLTGVFATLGCFLIGCCGSPMLAVYVAFLGTSFLGFAKPLIFVLSAISALAGWSWMNRASRIYHS